MRAGRTLGTMVLAAAVLAGSVSGISAPSSAAPSGSPTGGPVLDAPMQGAEALDSLDGAVAQTAERNDMRPADLVEVLEEDPSAWLDRDGRLFYVDEAAPAYGSPVSPVPAAAYPLSETLRLHSSPGSRRTLFLDFDGADVSGSAWSRDLGAHTTVPGLDLDGAPGFSATEAALVQEVWRQVAEDFAPFDVDVTTEDPGIEALWRSSLADAVYGTTVVFTADPVVEQALCEGTCGGIAYVDVFDEVGSGALQPAWAFTDKQHYSPEALAQTASHEAGHNLGLVHDGYAGSPYFLGQGAWATIMGGPTMERMHQWSNGDYAGATNTEDDLATIGRASGAPLRGDDHGDTRGAATDLGSTAAATARGLISTRSDIDLFRVAPDCAGRLRVAARGIGRGSNLDVSLRVLDAEGRTVAAADPPTPLGRLIPGVAIPGLDASLEVPVTAGASYVAVDGTGQGSPTAGGYSDYGSLGRYVVDLARTCTPVADRLPGKPSAVTVKPGDRRLTVTWAAPKDLGTHPVSGYEVRWSANGSGRTATVAADRRSYLVTGLTNGRASEVAVRARGPLGDGPWSTALRGTPATTPGRPAVSASSGLPGGTVTAKVTWRLTAAGGAAVTSCRLTVLRLDARGRVVGRTVLSRAGTARSATLVLPRVARYRFTVQAVNRMGAGPVSAMSAAVYGR